MIHDLYIFFTCLVILRTVAYNLRKQAIEAYQTKFKEICSEYNLIEPSNIIVPPVELDVLILHTWTTFTTMVRAEAIRKSENKDRQQKLEDNGLLSMRFAKSKCWQSVLPSHVKAFSMDHCPTLPKEYILDYMTTHEIDSGNYSSGALDDKL